LEKENARLKRLVGEPRLEKAVLRMWLGENSKPRNVRLTVPIGRFRCLPIATHAAAGNEALFGLAKRSAAWIPIPPARGNTRSIAEIMRLG